MISLSQYQFLFYLFFIALVVTMTFVILTATGKLGGTKEYIRAVPDHVNASLPNVKEVEGGFIQDTALVASEGVFLRFRAPTFQCSGTPYNFPNPEVVALMGIGLTYRFISSGSNLWNLEVLGTPSAPWSGDVQWTTRNTDSGSDVQNFTLPMHIQSWTITDTVVTKSTVGIAVSSVVMAVVGVCWLLLVYMYDHSVTQDEKDEKDKMTYRGAEYAPVNKNNKFFSVQDWMKYRGSKDMEMDINGVYRKNSSRRRFLEQQMKEAEEEQSSSDGEEE
mgnify:CR=1 FL=1